MSVNHQSPASNLAPFAYKTVNTTTWGASPNTCVITDTYINTNSFIVLNVTGTTPAAGRWSWTVTQDTLTITSSDGESSTLPISYIVL